MTAVSKLLNQSLSVKLINSADWALTGTENYIVTNCTSAEEAVEATGQSIGSSLDYNYEVNLSAICTDFTASSVENSAGKVWNLTFNYSSVIDLSFNAYSAEVGGTYVDCWRTQTSFGTGDPDNNDIGGTGIDSAGAPVSKLCVQSTVTTSRRYTAVPWSNIWAAVGKRNDAVYNGGAIGQLLMRGVRVTTIAAGQFEVQYTYESDQFFHMRQVPTREQGDQRIWLLNNKAKEVKNIQPFPTKISFATLIG